MKTKLTLSMALGAALAFTVSAAVVAQDEAPDGPSPEAQANEASGYTLSPPNVELNGRLLDISADFPDGPFELRYAGPAGSTMEITGLTSPGSYTGAGDGFSLRIDQGESGVYRLDSANVSCEIDLTHADEAGIDGACSCPFLGDHASGFFSAIP